jgi:hypothetical protein
VVSYQPTQWNGLQACRLPLPLQGEGEGEGLIAGNWRERVPKPLTSVRSPCPGERRKDVSQI